MLKLTRRDFLAAICGLSVTAALVFVSQIQPVMADVGSVRGWVVLLIGGIILAIVTSISLLPWLKQHVVTGTVIASICVVVGMWLEGWNIVVPTMTHPRLILWAGYNPSSTEWTLTAASFALFTFLFLILFKLFPPISIWEVAEGRVIEQAQAELELPLPESSTPVRRRRWGIARR